ncbi:histone acetyltransferase [Trifolium repens]|nr:histone acetyltransferase of the CBP family [Trifolium repens]WJX65861.1 histone acetyltransferase [Trifolium repens]
MPLKDSHLENTRIQMPTSSSSYVSNVPRKRAFDELSNQVGLSANWRDHPEITYNRRWMRKKISRLIGFGTENEKVATKLEWYLFLCADSKEAYMNQETLNQRVHFQLQKAGLSQHFIVPDLPRLPESIATFADTNVLYNSHVSGHGSYLPQQHITNLETNLSNHRDCLGTMKNFATTMGKSLQSADSNLMLPQLVSMDTSEHSNLFPRMKSSLELKDTRQYRHQELEFQNSFTHHGNTEAMLQPTKRQKMMEYAFGVSSVNDASINQSTHEMVQPCSFERLSEAQQQLEFEEYSVEQFTNLVLDSMGVSGINNNMIVDTSKQAFETDTFPFNRLEAGQISDEPDCIMIDCRNSVEIDSMPIIIDDDEEEDIQGRTWIEAKADQENLNPNEPDSIIYGMIDSRKSVDIDSMPTRRTELIIIDDDDDDDDEEEDIQGITGFNQEGIDAKKEFGEPKTDQENLTESSNTTVNEINNNVVDSSYSEATQISEEQDFEKDKQDTTDFNSEGTDAKMEVSETKVDQEKQTKSSNRIDDPVSLIDLFTHDQITKHISSFGEQSNQSTTASNTCQLCAMEHLPFKSVPIYCLCCDDPIKKKANLFCRKGEEFDADHCFCSRCYKKFKGGCITFNGTSVSKKNLEKKKNDEVFFEPWVECNKCKRWQHQICALYNNKRDLDCNAEYICPFCRLKEIENGMHVPLPKNAIFGAKSLPKTMLSDHLEKRLFERLMQERADWNNDEGKNNPDKVLAEESLCIREVLSVDKQLKVKKQFLDIIPEENYPSEFSYRLRVILLFQRIEGVDVCIFAMYVQEFGSECGNPNKRCVYISYLDSVNYFTPRRMTKSQEALRTFVYHEISIGYLDFCKKRGFTTCYIWSCTPKKGEDDYILYCHPKTQKTPTDDKLREWYLSMLTKASKENVVVGLTNIYDHFFVSTGNRHSKITTARLPYFDGDYWSGTAMTQADDIEEKCGGEYEMTLNKVMKTRSLKAMGHINPSKGNAKDILVMHRLDQEILPKKKNFIVAHLQYSCMHCCKPIVSGKRWFCTKCKIFQECERCHSSNVHTSINGEVHRLSKVLVDDIPFNTKQNDIIIENAVIENRNNFLSFCQKNWFQFNTLRHAKYSSMMILYHLKNSTLRSV